MAKNLISSGVVVGEGDAPQEAIDKFAPFLYYLPIFSSHWLTLL